MIQEQSEHSFLGDGECMELKKVLVRHELTNKTPYTVGAAS